VRTDVIECREVFGIGTHDEARANRAPSSL
jgi:hypothetical protein